MNQRLLQALRRQPVDKTPVWLMRQAGRYLPEYRRVRAEVKDFMQLCKTPELATEVTLQPLVRFPLDAAIMFSDILTIPDAMGLGLRFVEHEGPQFLHPVRSLESIQKLPYFDVKTELHYVMTTIRQILKKLQGTTPLIGFSGSPWTLATYMVEGGSSKTFGVIKKWLYTAPEGLKLLLELLRKLVTDYLMAQIEAGVHAVMIFDTWGGVLTPQAYQDFSLFYMTQIVKELKQYNPQIPVILFTKGAGQCLEKIAASGCDAVGIDWMTDLAQARMRIGDQVALQGNLDPACLYASPEQIQIEVKNTLKNYGSGVGHIFNLGHGVQLDTPPDHVAALVEAVHGFKG